MIKAKLNDKQLKILYSLIEKKNFFEEKLNLATNELNNSIQLIIEDDIELIDKVEIVEGNIEYELIESGVDAG